MRATGIARGEDADDVGGPDAVADQFEAIGSVEWIDQRLGRDGALPGLDVRHARADREELGRDRDGDASAIALPEDDRPRHRSALMLLSLISSPVTRGRAGR